MEIDFSKGSAIHRLYGHQIFVAEAKKQNKSLGFMKRICEHVSCEGDHIRWRNRL